MSDIPRDIESKADDVWYEALSGWQKYEDLPDPVPFIARAILAERERCAQIAENTVDFADDGLSTFDAAQIIAAAIRSPERAGE
nr:hypothetical protein RAR13_11765 [Aminobacter aminovorans]